MPQPFPAVRMVGIPGLDSYHGPSLLFFPTGGFQNLHYFEKRIMVKVLAGIVSRDSQKEVEPVNREYRQLVARAVGLSSTWGTSESTARR